MIVPDLIHPSHPQYRIGHSRQELLITFFPSFSSPLLLLKLETLPMVLLACTYMR